MREYTQTTEYTGAASALLMVLNHYNPKFKLTPLNEFKIWLDSVNLPTRACSIYGLANYALKKNIKCEIIVENIEYDYPDYRFKGYKKQDIKTAKITEKIHYRNLIKNKGIVKQKTITLEIAINLLKTGKILIFRLDAGSFRDKKPSSSYIVITKYKNNQFEIYDPYQGKLLLTQEQFVQCFSDLKEKRKRDPRMIVFS